MLYVCTIASLFDLPVFFHLVAVGSLTLSGTANTELQAAALNLSKVVPLQKKLLTENTT